MIYVESTRYANAHTYWAANVNDQIELAILIHAFTSGFPKRPKSLCLIPWDGVISRKVYR